MALPAIIEAIDEPQLLLLLVFDHVDPLMLKKVADLDAFFELDDVAAEGHRREAACFGEGLDPFLKVLALVHVVVADDDEGLLLFDELDGHALHVYPGITPWKVVEAKVRWILLDLGIVVVQLLKQLDVDTDVEVMGLGQPHMPVDLIEDRRRGPS